VWRTVRPHYAHLRYVVFFRFEPPSEILREFSRVVVSNPRAELFGFER
jgi:hypothetical protein